MQSNPVLPIGYSDVPKGHVAAFVTSLEMLRRPAPRSGMPLPAGFTLEPIGADLDAYRAAFRAVGQDWLWESRLVMPEAELRSILVDPLVQCLALRHDKRDVGILELDFREPKTCELVFFGLVSKAVGKGIGRTLMNEAIERAWSRPIDRFWVHTCTLDHPAALDFYRRSGFTPFKFQVEVIPDPRLTGLMPADCAPQIPLLG